VISHQILSKQIILHSHTISYHCASIIADGSNTGQRKNHISYLLSSLQRQHHHSTSLTTIDPSLHDGFSRLLGLSFRRSFGSAAGSSAAAEASAAGAAGAGAQPADQPAAASGPSCKGQGCKTENVMIGMNALIDLEYAAGTDSVECTDAQSMYSVQTALKLFRK
jgi:hypothetical protein